MMIKPTPLIEPDGGDLPAGDSMRSQRLMSASKKSPPGRLFRTRRAGQRVGLHIRCHSLRHTSITQAAELGQRAGLGHKIRAFSRHRTIATFMIYVDEHDRVQTQETLGDLVASTLTP